MRKSIAIPSSRHRSHRSRKPLCISLAAALLTIGAGQHAMAGGWYVSNTAPTEFVRYQRVYFSAGTYRFTARAGSPAAGATMHLEIDNVPVQTGIAVPNTGRADAFDYVHMGRKTVSQGYHDLKVVFNSAAISLDWFMMSKDTDASTSVKVSDITMQRPDTSGMLIAPVVAFGHVTSSTGGAAALCNYSTDQNLNPFSDAQIEAWYGIPIYQDFDRRSDRYWDNMVDDLMASRAQVPLLHCRETKDFTRSLKDRDYQAGPGHFEGRWLLKFAEAVARNPQAVTSLKIGMFWENGGIAALFKTRYGYYPSWGDPALIDYVMEFHLAPWFDSIPASMLYQQTPGRPIISLFANNPENMVNDGKMGDFVAALRGRLQEKYGYNPLFVLPLGGAVNAAVEAQGWGQCPWGLWTGPTLTPNVFKGVGWGTTCAGGRRRLDTVWLNDWNPAANTGTPATESPGVDNLRPRLDGNGDSVLLANFADAKAAGMKLVQQEGFTNMAEGNSIYRSFNPSWAFPNQHMQAMREYADPTTPTMLFEAEGCDDYFKVVNDGNSGGSYRSDWYSQGNDLDVYRPLHNLQRWISKSTGPGNFTQISASIFDAWAVGSDGKVWVQHIGGLPNSWTQITNAPVLTSISATKEYVWGLNGTTAYSAKTPYGWQMHEMSGWQTRAGNVVQLSAAISEVWGVNASGQIFRRPIDGSGSWVQITGTLDKVYAGESFVWGTQGSNIYYARRPGPGVTTATWTSIANPNNLTQIAVGSEEVWGVNAAGQIYRRSISGIGGWDLVTTTPGGTLTKLAVGEDNVWGLIGSTPYHLRMEGFANAVKLAPMINTLVAGNAQTTLTWTAVTGATGYHIKRATTAGGPYTTIASNILPAFTTSWNYTDTTAANGTKYYYVISALTPSGETSNSTEFSATPQSAVPIAPTGLTASSGFDSGITLKWSQSSTNEKGFKIERKLSSDANFVQVAVVGENQTSFVDNTALSGPSYVYQVCAYNAAGKSTYTSAVTVDTSVNQLSRNGWAATASNTRGDSPTTYALDGNQATRWSTGINQVPGQWFQVDLKTVNTLYQIDMKTVTGDYPKTYDLYLSLDGVNWGVPVTSGTGLTALTTATFAPQRARYVRIVQTGTLSAWWSMNEFIAYGHEELSSAGWAFSANVASVNAANAGDGNMSTRWTTGVATTPTSQWFQVDMGASRIFDQVVMDQGAGTNDYPAGYEVYVSDDGLTWGSAVATGSGTPGKTIATFAPQTARYIRVVRTGTLGSYWSINEFGVYAASAPLPSPWQTSDIGSVGVPGSNSYINPVYTVTGSGGDISGTADAFRYVYQTSSGDCSVVARVTSQQNTNSWAKAGVMLRETSAAGAINAALVVSNGALNFQWRSATGGATSTTGGGSLTFPNVWVKLTRTGNSISAFKSVDGLTWTQVGTAQTLVMASSATLGLAVTSHANTVTSTAAFDNVVPTP